MTTLTLTAKERALLRLVDLHVRFDVSRRDGCAAALFRAGLVWRTPLPGGWRIALTESGREAARR